MKVTKYGKNLLLPDDKIIIIELKGDGHGEGTRNNVEDQQKNYRAWRRKNNALKALDTI